MKIREKLRQALLKKYPVSFVNYVISKLEKENLFYYLDKKLKGEKDLLRGSEKALSLKWKNLYEDFWRKGYWRD